MSLQDVWRIRNANRTHIDRVINDLKLWNLSEDEKFLVKNTFEIAPFQYADFEEWISGFEDRYSDKELGYMKLSWEYSVIEYYSISMVD